MVNWNIEHVKLVAYLKMYYGGEGAVLARIFM